MRRSARIANIAIACLVMSAAFYRVTDTVVDPDLWGHVRFGLDIVESGQIVQTDRYSYVTAGQPWIDHEWLAEVASAWAYRAGGGTGLILFKTAISLLVLGLMYRFLYLQGLDVIRAAIPVLFVVFLLLYGFYTVRPQLFTYLFFLLILLAIHAAELGRTAWLFAAPPVFAVWVNAHGGFLAGMAVFLLWACVHLAVLVWRSGRLRALFSPEAMCILLAVVLSVLATLLNPNGASLIVFLLRTATVARPEVPEWQPLPLASQEGAVYMVLLALAVLGWVYSRRHKSLALALVLAAVAVQPLLAIRHIPLFAIAAIILAGPHWADVWNRWSPQEQSAPPATARARLDTLVASVAFLGAVALVALAVPNLRCIGIDPVLSSQYPSRAVARLKASGVSGNLALPFGWGEYVIWHVGPELRVSMDGRRETVYSAGTYARSGDFMNGVGDWEAFLTEFPTDLVLVQKGSPIFNLLKLHPGWVLCDEDSLTGLFAPRGSSLIPQIQGAAQPDLPADGVGLCFP
jgi:hypothetical protein